MTSQGSATLAEERIAGGAGLEIFVRSWQPATAPRAVVVICHGVKSHSGYYFWTAEQLVADGYAVYALDLHGRGKSDGERFYLEKFQDYLDDVARHDDARAIAASPACRCSCSVTAPAA